MATLELSYYSKALKRYAAVRVILPEIDKKEERVEAVRIRADAMDIRPWFGIHKQSETDFDSELLTLWSTK